MKKIVSIVVMFGILGTSLEGAADVAASGDPCCDHSSFVHGDPSGPTAEPSSETEDGCIVCTPVCHCGVHGSALLIDRTNDAFAAPNAVPTHIQSRYTSYVDPPFLPPPIL